MTLADLDGDGKEEIIATGVSNGYDHQATLVVLEPDRSLALPPKSGLSFKFKAWAWPKRGSACCCRGAI
jgi:hypothetical protein